MALPSHEQLAMLKLLPAMLAQKTIEEDRLNWMSPESVFRTVLLAYDDIDRAEAAQLESLRAIVNHECKR